MAEKKSYTVLSPLNHDKEDYAIGDPVALTDKQAAALIAVNVVEPASSAAEKAAAEKAAAEKAAAEKAAAEKAAAKQGKGAK